MENDFKNASVYNDTTISYENDGEDDSSNVGLVVGIIISLLVIISAVSFLWYYRRRHGHFPNLFKREQAQSLPLPPTTGGAPTSHHHRGSWQASWSTNNNKLNQARTVPKHRVSIFTIENENKERQGVLQKFGVPTRSYEVQGRKNVGLPTDNNAKQQQQRTPLPSRQEPDVSTRKVAPQTVGEYHNRTLPSTMMMSNECKLEKFSKRTPNTDANNRHVRRSSSVTETNAYSENLIQNIQKFNDFGVFGITSSATVPPATHPHSQERNNKRRPKKHSSSRGSSKPSNTSDYVSDLEVAIEHHNQSRKSNSKLSQTKKMRNQLIEEVAEQLAERNSPKQKSERKSRTVCEDERTESQQNTLKSKLELTGKGDGKHGIISDESDFSLFEGEQQSSDTESMADAASSVEQRQYESDGDIYPTLNGRRHKAKGRRRVHRASSYEWGSATSTIKPRASSQRRLSMHSRRNSVDLTPRRRKSKQQRRHRTANAFPPYQSSTLQSSIGRTLIELPIYSQATWSGPGTPMTRYTTPHRLNDQLRHQRKTARLKNHKGKPPDRTLSVGGGGRYVCEYRSLPKMSKLPKEIVAKIGGQPQRLMEPIEQLNFDQLCRPLPADGQNSARRLVIERMPADHRDREILSQTYEYEDSGLVSTDL